MTVLRGGVRVLLPQMLKYILLLIWPVLAFGGFFRTLFDDYNDAGITQEQYDTWGCPNYDKDFEDWGFTFLFLLENAIMPSASFECFHKTSSPIFATGAMYIFILIAVIMLLNML